MTDVDNMIAFQGVKGANSDIACHSVFPGMETLPCYSFEDTFAAVRDGKAQAILWLLVLCGGSARGIVRRMHSVKGLPAALPPPVGKAHRLVLVSR